MFVIAGAAVGAVGAYAAASAGASGAKDAANVNAQAASDATALQKYEYDQNRADLAPYRQSGQAGLGMLDQYLGIMPPSAGNMPTMPDRSQFMKSTPQQSGAGATPLSGLSSTIGQQYNPDGSVATQQQQQQDTQTFDQAGYDQAMQQYNTQLTAYQQQQQQMQSDPKFGSLLKPFSQTNWQADPGYQFRLSEGARGVENSAAAKGGFFSGNTGVALDQYNQNFASNEYNNAYNRYNLDQTNQFDRLASMAGIGQQATDTTAQLGANYANNASSTMMQGASNIGNAYQNAANARASGYQGVGNQLMAGIGQLYQNQLYNPTVGGYATNNAADTTGSAFGGY